MLFKRVLFLSVFFRGFRGHKFHHYQIETVPGPVNHCAGALQPNPARPQARQQQTPALTESFA
jgi:hypothetical protein